MELVNRVAQSGLITINLEEYYPTHELVEFDLKDHLFRELILKEKDFRESLKAHDWEQYKGKILLVFCSVDAIIPVWAYMLIASYASNSAESIFQGTKEEFLKNHYSDQIQKLDLSAYQDSRIVLKGCSDMPVPPSAYLDLTERLIPMVTSLMYGEPCSTVPIYKKKKDFRRKMSE